MENFWIIDGSSLVHREYFSTISLEMKYARTPEEKEAEEWRLLKMNDLYVNAINGFFTQLKALLTFQKVDYLAICFDKSRETTFRRSLYPEYKAQRTPTPFPLKQQMETTRNLCEQMGIQTFYSDEYEADDYAGSLTKKFAGSDVMIHLLTTDRDYLQLIGENVICHMMITNKEKMDQLVANYGEKKGPLGTYRYNADICYSELGVRPYQITDWKGMSGDLSDNMPGIKGVSDRTTIPLLGKYKTIGRIYQYLDSHTDAEAKEEWKALGITRPPVAAIRNGKEDALFFKELATIKTDIPIEKEIREFSFIPTNEMFSDLADEYGLMALEDLLDRIAEYEIKHGRNVPDKEENSVDLPPDNSNDNHDENINNDYADDADEYEDDFDMWA